MSLPDARSLLYVPASRPKMLARVADAPADLILLDLEDGVAPGDKDLARAELRRLGRPRRPFLLRVNPPGSPQHDADLALVDEMRPAGVVLPKAEDPSAVGALAARGRALALMIETARGVVAARALAAVEGVRMLIVGSADLHLSLGARPDPERAWERHALSEVLLAARAAGIAAIDSVYFRYQDEDGLRAHARIARDLGYDGKSAIHPGQVGPIHEVFAPHPDEIAWARRLLEVWEREKGDERGVVVCDGAMVEALHTVLARRILARAFPRSA